MLFLLFQLGKDRYALEATLVVEVLPLVSIKHIPRTPVAVAGVFNYRGAPVPVIDLTELTLSRPALKRLSTRIIVINYAEDNGDQHLLGLIAEMATETVRRAADFVASGVTNDAAAYLGPVATDARGLIQWNQVNQLLPVAVRELLFRNPVAR